MELIQLSTAVMRPLNRLRLNPNERAVNRHTSDAGLLELASRPETHAAATENILGRVVSRPRLAIAVVVNASFTPDERAAAIKNICEGPSFAAEKINYYCSTGFRYESVPFPEFFELLSGQTDGYIRATHELWEQHKPQENRGAIDAFLAQDQSFGQTEYPNKPLNATTEIIIRRCRGAYEDGIAMGCRIVAGDQAKDDYYCTHKYFFTGCVINGKTFWY
jgi:hypothetical protein